MKIYISASLVNHLQNARIAESLEKSGHEVFLPQRFCPTNVPKNEYPLTIFEKCLEAMKDCDLGILVLDCYGKDSSWESGWFFGTQKPLIGFVQVCLKLSQDWMVKGGLKGLITTDQSIKNFFIKDEMISHVPIIFIDTLNTIGKELGNFII